MRSDGKVFGINGQGMINHMEVEGRPRYASLGYGKGEIWGYSKVFEWREASREGFKPLVM